MRSAKQETKKSRGATRSKEKVDKRLPWLRYVLVVSVCVSCYVLWPKLNLASHYEKVKKMASRPVATVSIKGEFRFTSKQDVQQILEAQLSGNFVDLDLREVKLSVENNPWVEEVQIRRIWPDRLDIIIKEQQPIAKWGDAGFLNYYGQVISVEDNSLLDGLPLLVGDEKHSASITKKYVEIAELLADVDLRLTEIKVDDKMAWMLNVNRQFDVALGNENILDRLNDFLFVYKNELIHEKENIKSIDARYSNGIAVAWFDTEEWVVSNDG